MKKLCCLFLLLFVSTNFQGQNTNLPYANIPEPAEDYTAGSVVSRMLDGLGFRYYWATEGLTEKDLSFQAGVDVRTTEETIDHILDLSQMIVNSALAIPNDTPQPTMSFEEKRKKTLKNLEEASRIFRTAEDLSKFTIVFQRGDKTYKFPFWNQLNGPVSDAIWHVGQVVSFRRLSGNPLPKGVNLLTGTKN